MRQLSRPGCVFFGRPIVCFARLVSVAHLFPLSCSNAFSCLILVPEPPKSQQSVERVVLLMTEHVLDVFPDLQSSTDGSVAQVDGMA